jgi:hypothetical protein
VGLDGEILREAEQARARLTAASEELEQAIRRLYAAGGSPAEVAGALGLSEERVRDVIGEESVSPLPARRLLWRLDRRRAA